MLILMRGCSRVSNTIEKCNVSRYLFCVHQRYGGTGVHHLYGVIIRLLSLGLNDTLNNAMVGFSFLRVLLEIPPHLHQ